MTTDSHTYTVKWSVEDGEYVGLCDGFPSLSWLDKTPQKALVQHPLNRFNNYLAVNKAPGA